MRCGRLFGSEMFGEAEERRQSDDQQRLFPFLFLFSFFFFFSCDSSPTSTAVNLDERPETLVPRKRRAILSD